MIKVIIIIVFFILIIGSIDTESSETSYDYHMDSRKKDDEKIVKKNDNVKVSRKSNQPSLSKKEIKQIKKTIRRQQEEAELDMLATIEAFMDD